MKKIKEAFGAVHKYLTWLFNSKWGQHIPKMVLVAVISYQAGVGFFYLIQGEYIIALVMFMFSAIMGAFLFMEFNIDRYRKGMDDYKKLTDDMMTLIKEQNEQIKRLIERVKKYEGVN